MAFDNNNEMLKNMIEKILFDEKRLDDLKKGIAKLREGIINDKELRQLIFLQNQDIFDELIDFFPFYAQHQVKSREIDEFCSHDDKNMLLSELKERDDYLIEICKRLQMIKNQMI